MLAAPGRRARRPAPPGREGAFPTPDRGAAGRRGAHQRRRALRPPWSRRSFEELLVLVGEGQPLDADRVRRVVDLVKAEVPNPSGVFTDGVPVGRGKVVRPKSLNQKRYLDAIRADTVVFGIGPAGTGKTYLAMAAGGGGPHHRGGEPDHPHPPGGGGGGAARLPPRRPRRQGRSLPAALCTTPSTTCSGPTRRSAWWSGGPSRSPRWPTCGAAPSTMPSWCSTRRRTPRPSR